MEVWRDVPGWEGHYQVSSHGRVRSLKPGFYGRILAPRMSRKGYVRAALCRDGRHTETQVHRLVALAFIGNPSVADDQVNHINGVKTDNTPANLEWISGLGNMQHALRTGLLQPVRGERQGRAKLTWEKADAIRASNLGDTALAAAFGVSKALIHQVRRHVVWKPEHRPAIVDEVAS